MIFIFLLKAVSVSLAAIINRPTIVWAKFIKFASAELGPEGPQTVLVHKFNKLSPNFYI